MRILFTICFVVLVLTTTAGVAIASDFASELVGYKGLFGANPYDDPNVVLGEPTTFIKASATKTFACSMVYSAWNVSPDGKKLIVTLDTDAEIIVGFDHKVSDDPHNPFGIDLIVFGNAAFRADTLEYLAPDTDMSVCAIASPAGVLDERVEVSVAQDPNGPWYTFTDGPWGDDIYPTNAFAWDSQAADWSDELDWLRPVDPNLGLSDFAGLTVAQAIELYDGSAGGTGFDLKWLAPADFQSLAVDPETGRRWIQYIKVTSDELGEVDAFADVACCGDYIRTPPAGDVNNDCRVDMADFAVMAGNWLECTWKCE